MKVLMFGWEFPPHISGGLGTACYGLTTSLVKEGAEILFVVPKVYGNEPDNGVDLINASHVKINQAAAQPPPSPSQSESGDVFTQSKLTNNNAGITTIEVPSFLSPYALASAGDLQYKFQEWNYEDILVMLSAIPQEQKSDGNYQDSAVTENTYSFNGGYGDRLIEEVYHYSRVAESLSKQYEFDIIHAHDWMTFPAAIAAKRVSGKPLVIHVHATEYDRAGKSGNQNVYRIEKEAMIHADRIVTVSRWTKDMLVKHYRIRASKVEVVHNGIIPETRLNKEEIHPIGRHVVTFMGRITYQKGPEYFVEAAKKVSERFPDTHFIMAGAGDFLPQIIKKVAHYKLSSRFHFTGFLRKLEMDKILSYTRVYVMPSVSEPFGITPLEAVQAGVPVIISNQSGVGEVMEHALKVDFWDTDALSQAICSVLQYKSLADTLKKNSALEINSITWEKAAKKLNAIYHELTYKT